MGKRKADCTPEEWARIQEQNRERLLKWRAENPEAVIEQRRNFYVKNREQEREQTRKWYAENKEKGLERARKDVKALSPAYVARCLHIPVAECPPELIEMKREQLMLVRLTKQLKEKME